VFSPTAQPTGSAGNASVVSPGTDILAVGVDEVGAKVANLAVAKAGLLAAAVSIGVNLHPLAGIALFWIGVNTPDQSTAKAT
jgi:hypothetical protein